MPTICVESHNRIIFDQAVSQALPLQPYPDGKLGTWRARWAQIAMGVITNFVADGQPAARIVKETVLAVMDSAHEREGLLTFHAPFTTECAQCIRILYHREQRTVSESTEEVRPDTSSLAQSCCVFGVPLSVGSWVIANIYCEPIATRLAL